MSGLFLADTPQHALTIAKHEFERDLQRCAEEIEQHQVEIERLTNRVTRAQDAIRRMNEAIATLGAPDAS